MSELDLVVRLKADNSGLVGEVRVTKEELDKLGSSVERTGRRARDGARGMSRWERAMAQSRREARLQEEQNRRLARSYGLVRTAIAAVGVSILVREFAQAADVMTLARSRLRLVTESEQELALVERELFAAAQDTRSSYEGTVELYARVARNAGQLGATQAELFAVTTAVNQAIQVSGATSQEASAGVVQLAQALASGELRGDELRSVMEQMPRLAEAIADGLGVTIGELRDLGQEGQLSAELVFDALLSQAETIEDEFNKLDRTVGQALTQLKNDMLAAVGAIDDGTGATESLVIAIDEIREVVADPAFREGLAAVASGTADVIKFTAQNIELLGSAALAYAGARTAVAGFTAAQLALNIAMRANPVGLVVTAVSALVGGVALLADAMDDSESAQRRYNDRVDDSIEALRMQREETQGLAQDMEDVREAGLRMDIAKGVAELLQATENIAMTRRVLQEQLALQGDSEIESLYVSETRNALETLELRAQGIRNTIKGLAEELATPLPTSASENGIPSGLGLGDDSDTNKISERTDALAFELAIMERNGAEQAVLSELRRAGSVATIGQFESLESFVASLSAEERELANVTLALHDRARIMELAAQADEVHAETIDDIRQRLLDLAPTYQSAIAEADRWRTITLAGLDETAAGYEDFAAEVEEIYEGMLADAYDDDLKNRRDWAAGVERALRDATDRASDHATAFENLTTGSLDQAEDAWVDFVRNRKVDLSDLGAFIEDWAARYLYRLAIEPGLEAGANFLQQGGGDIIGSVIGSIVGGGSGTGVTAASKHTGGLVGAAGPSRAIGMAHFENAQRFHTGGEVLGPGEVPIVARAGEFVFTPEQMDGASGIINALAGIASSGSSGETRVEIINNTGQPATATAQRTRGPSGEDMLRVTLEPIVADSIARGQGGQAIEENYVTHKRLTHRD